MASHPKKTPPSRWSKPPPQVELSDVKPGDRLVLRVDLGPLYNELLGRKTRGAVGMEMWHTVRCTVDSSRGDTLICSQATIDAGKGEGKIPGLVKVYQHYDRGMTRLVKSATLGLDERGRALGTGGIMSDTWWIGGTGRVTSLSLDGQKGNPGCVRRAMNPQSYSTNNRSVLASSRKRNPSKSSKAAVRAAGLNYGAAALNAPIKIQQKFYAAYMRWVAKGYDADELAAAGKSWWNARAMRGPGVDW